MYCKILTKKRGGGIWLLGKKVKNWAEGQKGEKRKKKGKRQGKRHEKRQKKKGRRGKQGRKRKSKMAVGENIK